MGSRKRGVIMDTGVLGNYLAIAQEGSITKAAARRHMSQPSLTRQIKELEREFGQTLLERQSHGVKLTEAGQVLRSYAEQMIELAEKAEFDLEAMKNKPLGDVYVGGAETEALRFMARCLTSMRVSHPGIRLHYTSGNLVDIASKLDRGLLDLAILSQPANLSKYDTLELPRTEQWVLYMRRENPLARKERLRRADLEKEPLILSKQVLGKRVIGNNIADWFGDGFDDLDVVATFNLAYAGSILVQEGVGSMLTWDGLIEPTELNGLVTRPLDPPLESWLALAWRKGERLSRAAQCFLDALADTLDGAVERRSDEPRSTTPRKRMSR